MDKLDELGASVNLLLQFNDDEMTRMILLDCQSLYSNAVETDTHPAQLGLGIAEIQGLVAKEQG